MGINRLSVINYNAPDSCEECGGTKIKYAGIGEYCCEGCGHIMYDDYGVVRNFLEKNQGATVAETSLATGVSKNKIRMMLVDDKIQVTPGSMVFLNCSVCGAQIRSGRYCEKCAAELKNSERTAGRISHISGGYGKAKTDTSGVKRFDRN